MLLDEKMTYTKLKANLEIEAVDIPTMAGMSLPEYKSYLDGGLLFVDHHGVLRSGPAEYPLATSKEQLDALLEYIKVARHKMEA